MKLNVIIFEKFPLYLSTIKSAISNCSEIDVVGVSSSEHLVYSVIENNSVDVLITRYSKLINTEFLYRLSILNPHLKVLGIIVPEKDFQGRGMMRISDQCYISQFNSGPEELIEEMRQICDMKYSY